MTQVGQEVSSIMDTLSLWGPIVGSLLVNLGGIFWASAQYAAKITRIEEKIGEKDGDLKALEERLGKKIDERSEAVKDLEERLAFRMTEMEARQSKLEDFMLKEIRYVLDIVQQVKADVKGIDGYMRAQSEKPTRSRR